MQANDRLRGKCAQQLLQRGEIFRLLMGSLVENVRGYVFSVSYTNQTSISLRLDDNVDGARC